MKKNIYKISIPKWEKYNPNMKKSYKCIMLSVNFLQDPKIRQLTPVTKLLFLSCLLVAGESQRSQFEVSHESLVFQSGVKSGSLESQLGLLQSLQLLTFEKITPLLELNRIEKNRIKLTRQKKSKPEKVETEKSKKAQPVDASASPPKVEHPHKTLIARYCECWKQRYKSARSPHIMPQNIRQLKTLLDQVGEERALKIIEGYLQMPDSWFVTRTHDISTMVSNLNKIQLFIDSGRMITKTEIKQLDLAVTNQQTFEALQKGEI